MNPIKNILKTAAVYLVCVLAIGMVIYACIALFAQKTFYLDQKQWNPAEPAAQHIDPERLAKALDYIDTRLPTARSLLLVRNGKTVVEEYYWHGGPQETDYLHSLNLPLLQVLIGIAIDRQLIQGPDQPLSAFFPKHLAKRLPDGSAPLTLNHLLWAQAPLLWGTDNPDYWELFYAEDRIESSLGVISRQWPLIQPTMTVAAAYLLSRVIERVSGQSVFHFASRYLFQPLGISTYAADDNDLPTDAMVGFQLKALDLAKVGYLISQEGAWEGRQIVSKAWMRQCVSNTYYHDLNDIPGGEWGKTTIGDHGCVVARGDGGQYLMLVPSLQVVAVVTSSSHFPLPQDKGRDRLLELIVASVQETPDTESAAATPELEPETAPDYNAYIFEPNYVTSTAVPRDILAFFDQFAKDIASKDTRRIARHYARAYDHQQDQFTSPSRLMFGGSPPPLEYVHIDKIRIEKNRAYLRGKLKVSHRTYAGPQGVYPLENLIKLKGRWKWLGLPPKTDLLDRDDYFDAELSDEQHRFLEGCADPLMGKSSFFGNDCFAETFQSEGGGKALFANRIRPFLKGNSGGSLHITGVQQHGAATRVQGYIGGSAVGELGLPGNLHIVKENGAYKWKGAIDSTQI